VQSLREVARETLRVIETGAYLAPSGRKIVIADDIAAAIDATVVHPPSAERDLRGAEAPSSASPRLEVWAEGTSSAGRRLVQTGNVPHVVALNFASAKNPGGGFQNGAKAQEEDLARCSALYACLKGQHEFYAAGRSSPSALYTDHIIYSPAVPFFRDEQMQLLEDPFLLSIITAAAPNAGIARSRGEANASQIHDVLRIRARKVLRVAAHHGHSCLVLGAWGCGVFRNDPDDVADAFARALDDPELKGAFERVVFAIRDPGGTNLQPFSRLFGEVQL
jgi:uncharacterized protein (TIGR02452 family)